MRPGTKTILAGTAVFAAMSIISVQTPEQQKLTAAEAAGTGEYVDEAGGATGGAAAAGGDAPGRGGDGTAAGGKAPVAKSAALAPTPAGLECAPGKNGGSTDKGVSATKIRLASTHVLSGQGSSFLGSSHVGMEAVVSNVNSAGGICGRLLELTLRDDAWDAALGASFIQNFVNDGSYFALPVVPSSEGLTQAIKSRYIGNGKMPVIGTDGMLKEQYQDPYVWPVATATVSTMRVMAKHAYEKLGARQFGIVYDSRYKFGKEGARAFKDFVSALPGASVPAYVGIQPGQPSYPDAETFNSKCGAKKRCEFVAMLLEPGTAISWINSMGDDNEGRRLGFGSKGTGGAQPLFNARFARDCGEACNGMFLWTGYNPPIGERKNLPGVSKYMQDVKAIDPGVDVHNQFLEGAYLGMSVFVEALKKVGPNLTRERLRQAMDSMTFTSDLASTLTYGPRKHYANTGAQAFVVRTAAGSFADFADAGTGFITDPRPGDFPDGD